MWLAKFIRLASIAGVLFSFLILLAQQESIFIHQRGEELIPIQQFSCNLNFDLLFKFGKLAQFLYFILARIVCDILLLFFVYKQFAS